MHKFILQIYTIQTIDIDDIFIDLWFFENFASIEDIRRKCNLMVNLSKFTTNKKILSKIITLGYNTKFVIKLSI